MPETEYPSGTTSLAGLGAPQPPAEPRAWQPNPIATPEQAASTEDHDDLDPVIKDLKERLAFAESMGVPEDSLAKMRERLQSERESRENVKTFVDKLKATLGTVLMKDSQGQSDMVYETIDLSDAAPALVDKAIDMFVGESTRGPMNPSGDQKQAYWIKPTRNSKLMIQVDHNQKRATVYYKALGK
jgi:hypothetical protein